MQNEGTIHSTYTAHFCQLNQSVMPRERYNPQSVYSTVLYWLLKQTLMKLKAKTQSEFSTVLSAEPNSNASRKPQHTICIQHSTVLSSEPNCNANWKPKSQSVFSTVLSAEPNSTTKWKPKHPFCTQHSTVLSAEPNFKKNESHKSHSVYSTVHYCQLTKTGSVAGSEA